MKVKIKKLYENIVIPKKESINAVCRDVIVNEIIQTDSEFAIVKLGFSTEIPIGYKGCIVPRSSFTQKGWVMQNSPAQIDSDYRGEWIIKFEAIPHYFETDCNQMMYDEFPYKVGDRCAQIYFEKELEIEFEEVEELSNTERGIGSYGSTGN